VPCLSIDCVPSAPLLQTIENTRELVEDTPRTAEEVAAAEADDEFADHFTRARAPKVLVTTCYRPTAAMYRFLTELLQACFHLAGLIGVVNLCWNSSGVSEQPVCCYCSGAVSATALTHQPTCLWKKVHY